MAEVNSKEFDHEQFFYFQCDLDNGSLVGMMMHVRDYKLLQHAPAERKCIGPMYATNGQTTKCKIDTTQ